MPAIMWSTSTASLLLAGLIGSANAITCYSGVNVFTARGTGEVPPTGLGIEGIHINAILSAIPDSNATVVDYPASVSNNSVAIGVQNGTRQVEEYLDACPTSKIVIVGYSQGAAVQGYVLTGATFAIGPDGTAQNFTVDPLPSKYADQIVAIVFFGDPGFNVDIGVNSDTPFPCNVSSNNPRRGDLWESYGPRLEEWCNYSDFACCGTGSTFTGHISYFSGGNATITADFVAGKYNAAMGKGPGSSSSSSSARSSATLSSSVAKSPSMTGSMASKMSSRASAMPSLTKSASGKGSSMPMSMGSSTTPCPPAETSAATTTSKSKHHLPWGPPHRPWGSPHRPSDTSPWFHWPTGWAGWNA